MDESGRPKLSLLDRLRGRTVAGIEFDQALSAGEVEAQCQANWMTGGEGRAPTRCPSTARQLIEATTPVGELKMGVCGSHQYLVGYLDGSLSDLEHFDLDMIIRDFQDALQPLVQSSLEEAIGWPYADWLREANARRAASAHRQNSAEVEHQTRDRRRKAAEHQNRPAATDI